MNRSIFIGFDPREASAYVVARESIERNLSEHIPIYGVVLSELRPHLYWRLTERRLGRLWDVTSNAPMSTEFAISRFLVPQLAQTGLALFLDCDILARGDVADLFKSADTTKAVSCVKHDYAPSVQEKMDGQLQTTYPRKNWSSVLLFNCDHPSNRALSPYLVNNATGRELHGFCWLGDDEIGSLDPSWNWLVGEQPEPEGGAKIVHWTNGGPWLEAFRDAPYAREWESHLCRWAA